MSPVSSQPVIHTLVPSSTELAGRAVGLNPGEAPLGRHTFTMLTPTDCVCVCGRGQKKMLDPPGDATIGFWELPDMGAGN